MMRSVCATAMVFLALSPELAAGAQVDGGYTPDWHLYGGAQAWVAVTAGPGETNNLEIARHPGDVVMITDQSTPLTVAPERQTCVQQDVNRVSCQLGPAAPFEINVGVGDGDDSVLLTGALDETLVAGGEGADVLTGGTGRDTLMGGPGGDAVSGGGGNDTIVEDSSSFGPDTLDGGDGIDQLSYEGRSVPLRLDLRLPAVGEPGDEDLIRGFENLMGGDAPDDLLGTDGPNVIHYGTGDKIDSLAGNDEVWVLPTADGGGPVACGTGLDTVEFQVGGQPRLPIALARGCERLSFHERVEEPRTDDEYNDAGSLVDLRKVSIRDGRLRLHAVERCCPTEIRLFRAGKAPSRKTSLGSWRSPDDETPWAVRHKYVPLKLTTLGRKRLQSGRTSRVRIEMDDDGASALRAVAWLRVR